MVRYFKTQKNSETGSKFAEIEKIIKERDNFIDYVKRSYKCKSVWLNDLRLGGGIRGLDDFETEITFDWKKTDYGFYPKLNRMTGKSIDNHLKQIPKLNVSMINDCVGLRGAPNRMIGFNLNNLDYYAFSILESWEFEVPIDCIEISNLEYKNL